MIDEIDQDDLRVSKKNGKHENSFDDVIINQKEKQHKKSHHHRHHHAQKNKD
jgi:hypothetical protein